MTHRISRTLALTAAAALLSTTGAGTATAQYTQEHRHEKHEHVYDPLVAEAQSQLKVLHLYTGRIDGLMGPQTRQALLHYQHDESLTETGTPDDQTMARLRSEHRH